MTFARRLAKSIRHYLAWPQFPECRPALVCQPVDTDDEIAFYEDMCYLDSLRDAIIRDCAWHYCDNPDTYREEVGQPLLAAVGIPVESQQFWDEFGAWPDDHALMLINSWRVDNELHRMIAAMEAGEAA